MAKDVLITPGQGKIEFSDTTLKGQIYELNGDLYIDPLTNTLIIGDGSAANIEMGSVGTSIDLILLGGGNISSNGGQLNIGIAGDVINFNVAGVTYNFPSTIITTTDYTATDVLTKLKTVDGTGSGLDADLLDGQQGSYYLTAGNFTGTIPSAVLGNSSLYIGTTQIALNRASAALALTGITSIDGSAATLTTARTLTIGSTGKTFNGGADVSWSLAEIGAQAAGNYQPLDADLTAIAALSGTTGLLKKTAADTWTLDTTAYTTNTGTVTSVGMTVPTGLSVTPSPITTSGTFAISLTSGYAIPTTASQTNWDSAYSQRLQWDGGSTNLVAATGRTSLGLGGAATLNVGTASGTVAAGDHTHNYAGSSSAGGAANSVANSLIIKFDTGTTENTSLYTFNGSAAKTIDIKGGTNVTLTETANTVTISATDTNTTYTFATGTTNGAFSVTPSGGSAQSVSIYGLGSAAYTNSNAYAATNQTMYIGTTAVTINRASGALSLTGVSIDGNAGTVTNGVYTSGSYSDPSWLTISKSKVGLGNVENTALSTWAGSTNITTIGAATATSLSVTGNLIVNGTTTTVHSTTVTLDDPILTLGGDTAPTVDDNKDRGVEFRWHDGTSGKTGFFGFDDSTGYFTFIPDATNTSEVFSGTQGDIQAGNFRGTLIGSISNAITFNTTGGAAAGTTYNGSAARTIDYSTVGAASAGHTHNYAGSSSAGGAATSALTTVNTVTGTNSAELVRGNMADNDQFRILVGGTGSNAGYAEIATADDGTEPIYVRQYTGVFTSLTRTLTLLDASGNTSIPGNLSVTGTLSASGYNNTNWDNAYSQRLQWDGGSTNLVAATGRTSLGATTIGSNLFTLTNPSAITFIRINADNTVSALDAATFRTAIGAGTGNGTVTSVGATSPVASSGGSAPTISLNSAYGDTLNPYGSKTANYFLAAPNGSAGAPTFRAIVAADIPTLNQNTTGSAAKWTTARTVSFATGDVTGSFSIDGSADVSNVNLQVADDSHNHSSSSGNFQVGGDLYAVGGNLYTNSGDSRTKIGFWGNGDTTYGIGMASAYTFGGLNDYALTFQMSNTDARGFWFGDSTHTNAQGAMALTTTGLLTVASGLRIGYGESDSGDPVANVVDVSGALKVNTGTQSSKTSANSPVTLHTLAVSGTTNTCMVADYTVVNTGGTAQRSGTVTCNFNASNVTYTSTATPDLGTSTAAVTIAPVISSGSVLLRATITGADTWNIKVSVRYF